MKRIVAVCVILTMVLPSFCSYAADEPEVFVFEEFNTYASGIPIGWTSSEVGISPAKGIGGGGARLKSTEALYDANMQQMFSPPITGKIVMEAKVWMPNVTFRRALFTFKDSGNRENLTVMFNNNGYITVAPGDIKVMMYQPEKWYHVQVHLDTDTRKLDLYINGKLMLEDHSIANQEINDVTILRFGQWDRNNAYFIIDDIFLYHSETVISTQDLKEMMKVTFSDIEDSWARESIEYFAELKLLKKTEDGKFNPNKHITNKEMAEIIYNAMRFSTREYMDIFSDVTKKDSLASALQALVDAGVVSGSGEKFYPDETVALEQAIKPLLEIYKYVKQKIPGEEKMNFKNTQELGDWGRNYVGQANHLSLFAGVKDIKPKNVDIDRTITRAHFIVMFNNLFMELNKK